MGNVKNAGGPGELQWATSMEALRQRNRIISEISERELQIYNLQEIQRMAETVIMLEAGRCPECEGAHWPHCITNNEEGC